MIAGGKKGILRCEDTPSEIPREETFHAFLDKVKFWINVCSEGEKRHKIGQSAYKP